MRIRNSMSNNAVMVDKKNSFKNARKIMEAIILEG